MGILTTLAAAGVLALAVSFAAIPLIIRIAHRKGWYDLPNGRKVHTSPLPRLGGVGIFAALLVSILVSRALPLRTGGQEIFSFSRELMFVLAGFLVIFATGLIDDFRNLAALLKFFLQAAAAVLVTLGGFTIYALGLPGLGVVQLGWFAWPVTVLWLVGLSNAMNLVDGVDGFAGVIAAAAALALGASALVQGRPGAALVAVCLLGAVAGFLVFNHPPARIFMGDSGSLLLGFALATLPLLRGPNHPDGATLALDLAATVAVLGLPVLDTATSILRRLHAGQPILQPDKLHLHHKLQALSLADRTLFLVALATGVVLGAIAFTAVRVGGWIGWGMLVAAGVILSVLFRVVRRAAVQRLAPGPAKPS
ncbi:MAG: MraY family glycosyltransferase [Spirochaetes bacterium]|nr:MraY family glycosyltransferase [Spirochaetota bacterium]